MVAEYGFNEYGSCLQHQVYACGTCGADNCAREQANDTTHTTLAAVAALTSAVQALTAEVAALRRDRR